MTIGATTYRIVYNKSCYTTDTIYLGDIQVMKEVSSISGTTRIYSKEDVETLLKILDDILHVSYDIDYCGNLCNIEIYNSYQTLVDCDILQENKRLLATFLAHSLKGNFYE